MGRFEGALKASLILTRNHFSSQALAQRNQRLALEEREEVEWMLKWVFVSWLVSNEWGGRRGAFILGWKLAVTVLNRVPSVLLKDRLGDQRGGEWMGADKNSSRGRLKLRQDELAQSDPQNHTLRTSTFRLPKPRSHWSATGPRNKLHQQPQHTRTNDSGNNSKAG
jgi:hypothetical protein